MLYALAALIVSAAASYYTLRRRRHGLDDGMNNDRAKRYLEGFAKRDASCSARGLCGRFIRGVNAQQLSTLSDEPGKLFSWVCTDELLQGVLGKGPAGALVQVGFGLDWIRARLDDGTTFRLVVFPVGASSSTTQATWDNLFTLVRAGYGDAIANRLAPHMAALRSTPIDAIDTAARLRSVSNLPVSEKMAHPEYMTAEQFLAVSVRARGQPWHIDSPRRPPVCACTTPVPMIGRPLVRVSTVCTGAHGARDTLPRQGLLLPRGRMQHALPWRWHQLPGPRRVRDCESSLERHPGGGLAGSRRHDHRN